MTAPAERSVQLHCHHCSHWLGEASGPLVFAGMFKHPEDRNLLPGKRETYRCKGCGWVNVFQAEQRAEIRDWRTVALKHHG